MINIVIKEIKEQAKANFVPLVRDNTSKLLLDTVNKAKPKKILEIGTGIGYSGILMIANSSASLVTIELNEERARQAKLNFDRACLSDRASVIIGDCNEIIRLMSAKFDFIFLDGPKSNYVSLLPYLINLLNEKGILFVDNVSYRGIVIKGNVIEKKHRTTVVKLREFREAVEADSSINSQFIEIDDGVAIITKKEELCQR